MRGISTRTRATVTSVALAVAAAGAVATAAPASAAETVRISTSTTDVRDAAGNVWRRSAGFSGGSRFATAASTPIAGTSDDALYRTERFGSMSFAWPVADGTYAVTLKLAEIYWKAPARRVFRVQAEGATVVSDLDIFDEVGRNVAHDRSFRVSVTDGRLDLRFTASRDHAKLSALSFVRVGGATPAPAPAPAPATASSGRPDASNTGVPTGTTLRRHDGNLTITKAGARYDALDIHGFVSVQAPDVKITRSIVRGGVARGNIGLVTNYSSTATGFVLEDSELVPKHPSVWIDGAKGGNFTLRRVEVRGTVDAVKVHGSNVVVEDSWLHSTKYFSSDPNQDGKGTHNDGVQILGGRNIRIRDNSISGAGNAAIMVSQDHSTATDVKVTGNFLDGGACTVNLTHRPRSTMSGVTVQDNRFGRASRYNCPILASRGTSVTTGDNVYADNGASVALRR